MSDDDLYWWSVQYKACSDGSCNDFGQAATLEEAMKEVAGWREESYYCSIYHKREVVFESGVDEERGWGA